MCFYTFAKFIADYFLFLTENVFFLNSLFHFSLIVCRNIIDFCIMILYPVKLLNSFIIFNLENSSHYFLNILSSPFSFFCPSGILVMWMLVCLIVFHRSLKLWSFFFSFHFFLMLVNLNWFFINFADYFLLHICYWTPLVNFSFWLLLLFNSKICLVLFVIISVSLLIFLMRYYYSHAFFFFTMQENFITNDSRVEVGKVK